MFQSKFEEPKIEIDKNQTVAEIERERVPIFASHSVREQGHGRFQAVVVELVIVNNTETAVGRD